MTKKLWIAISPLLFGLAVGCAPAKPPPTLEEIGQFTKIHDLMKVHGRTADPLFKKAKGDFAEGDWAGVADSAKRLEVASLRVKALSKGVRWDELATQLNTQSQALGQAAIAKDSSGAKATLQAMKQTCKDCHSKYR
jgi:hypothetical protein